MLGSLALVLIASTFVAGEYEHWYMNEEWYDWHPWLNFESHTDGTASVEVHFVGPGAGTPRGIYVRGDADAQIEKIVVERIADHRGAAWKAESTAIEAMGTPTGKRWVRLARGVNGRGFEPLTLRLSADTSFDYVCISPNERYITHGRAERWIRDTERGKEVRCGMPLGGIGAGKVEIARDGWLRNITTNNNIDAPFYHPQHCFLAASINGERRILRDEPGAGLPAVDRIAFSARYPIATAEFSDEAWPIDIDLTAWSPIIAGNIDDSSLPLAVFEFELTNDSDKPVSAQVGLSWEHLIGRTGRPQPIGDWSATGHYYRCREDAGNTVNIIRREDLIGVIYRGGDKTDPDAEGHHILAVPKTLGAAATINPLAAYKPDPQTAPTALPPLFSADARPAGSTLPAAVVVKVDSLAPGQKVRIPIVLAWYMDHFHQLGDEDLGHYYQNRFSNAEEVAAYLLSHRDRLWRETKALHDLFDGSDLPAWYKHTLINDLYVLSTDTWITRDGRFSVNEGASNMYGVMGTMDQKLYASHHLALLFPELQKQELSQFGQLQNANGCITHDLGTGQFSDKLGATAWPDLCSAFSILSYQVYRYTADETFWHEIRPKIISALECLATTWDRDGLGVPGRGSTFDDEDSYRIFSYTTGLYLCTLRLGMEIAREFGDDGLLATYRRRYDRAHDLAMTQLWTGAYFRYGSSPPPESKRTDASHFSQLAGEFWCRLLGLDGTVSANIRQTALASVLRLHWNDNFRLPPKIVTAAGKLFPRNGAHRNAPVSWPMHSRALMSGPALLFDMENRGWDLLRAMHDNALAANGPDPWDQSLYWDPITARRDWGTNYMTAPASWLAHQAMIDTHYDAVTGTLTLRPKAAARLNIGRFPVILPLLWGIGSAKNGGQSVSLSIERCLAEGLQIRRLRLVADLGQASLRVDGHPVPAILRGDLLVPETPVALRPGLQIDIN